jgi:hypothetical protein
MLISAVFTSFRPAWAGWVPSAPAPPSGRGLGRFCGGRSLGLEAHAASALFGEQHGRRCLYEAARPEQAATGP